MPANLTRPNGLDEVLDRIPVGSAHRTLIGLVMVGVFVDAVEQNAVGLAGPALTSQWGLSARALGLLGTITFLAVAAGRLLAGALADRHGRRPVLLWTMVVLCTGSLLCAFAPNYHWLAVGRVIVGLGVGAELAVSVILLMEFFSARHRGTAVGLLNVAGGGLGNLLAPVLALAVFALLPGADGWRFFFGALALPIILVAWFRRFVPESPRYLVDKGRFEEADQVLSRLAAGRLRGAVDVVSHFGTTATSTTRRATARDVFTGPLRRGTVALGIVIAMSYAAQWTVLTFVPTLLMAQGYSISRSLVYTVGTQAGSVAGAALAAFLVRRHRRKPILTVAAVLAFVWGLAFGTMPDNAWLLIGFGALFNGSIILINTTVWVAAPELYPTSVRGIGTSTILAAGSISGALAPLVAGVVLDADGVSRLFTLLAGLFVILAVAVQFAPETHGRSLDEG